MRKLITLMTAAVLLIVVCGARHPDSASAAPTAAPTILELPSGVAPGISTLSRLTFKVNEGQYAFTRKCASFDNYTGVRTHGVSCASVKRFVERHTPAAFNCFYFGLRMSYLGESDGVPVYRSNVTRIDCNNNSTGAAFAVTAR